MATSGQTRPRAGVGLAFDNCRACCGAVFATMIEGLAEAKEAGLPPDAIKAALQFIDEAPRDG